MVIGIQFSGGGGQLAASSVAWVVGVAVGVDEGSGVGDAVGGGSVGGRRVDRLVAWIVGEGAGAKLRPPSVNASTKLPSTMALEVMAVTPPRKIPLSL
jgi:hypothetical protein